MIREKLARSLPFLFLVIFVTYLVVVVREKPRVLILHSYNVDYSWTQEVSEGINRVLAGKPYTLRWHYMDTKRHPDEHFKTIAGQSARNVIDQWRPHVLIAIADNAQLLVASHYLDDPHMAIVFAGVTDEPSAYGYVRTDPVSGKTHRTANVTGILERWPMEVIRHAIEDIFIHGDTAGHPLRVRHIGDRSTTGLIIARGIRDYKDWGTDLAVTSVEVGDFEAWKTEILRANQEVDLVLFSLYHTLTQSADEDKVVPPLEVMTWTNAHLEKPGIGGWGFFAEQGGMMAIGVSAYEQGEEAAKMVTAIIDDGKQPSQITPKRSRQFLVYLREGQLKKYGVAVPLIFEAFARATNNYYED